MSRSVAALAFVALTACAAMQPGEDVSRSFASEWGCEYRAVMARADTLAEELPEGEAWIPQVGWDVCELLARNGRPDDVDRQQSRYGRSADWWYETAEGLKLVSLERRAGTWIVDYVGF